MAVFKLPLSGDVPVNVAPFLNPFGIVGSNFSFMNIDLGQSSAPQVEQQVLKDVGSYGKQLGRVGDALRVIVEKLDERELSKKDKKAVRAFLAMLDEIDDIKRAQGRAPAPNGEAP
ncbi:hypothetical protein [Methylocystis iwaonis]|uniref:Uncharacterized protein n=1 Tax=Methylocystis iwaonis TaxID=2885079 RepID=A0ABM8EA57_9HYPH|nr:hypothetical protein [Methylocystis iwaonis]BDV34886.1 hypothetical protein SS37A_24150 [Methylocystis iwaonis]